MVLCPDCGKDVPQAKFCKNCGSRLPDVSEVKQAGNVEDNNEIINDIPIEEESVDEDIEIVTKAIPVEDESVGEDIEIVTKAIPVEDESVGEDSEKVTKTIPIEDDVQVSSPAAGVGSSPKFCSNCGLEINGDFRFCPNCGFDLNKANKSAPGNASTGKVVTATKDKNIILAIILSVIFPGLGQIYLGLDRKGSMFLIGYVISIILIILFIGILLCFVIWIWALVDTIQSTNALNRGESVEDKLL